jgi:hypothetical protein
MRHWIAGAALLLCMASSLPAQDGPQDGPRVIFSKSFPGSLPPYVEISIGKTGAGVYKEDPKDEDPLTFRLSEDQAAQIFGLAAKLDYFSRKLESGLKVANMGMKTFRYDSPEGGREVKFNYSEDPDARTLADLFEQISETERTYINLERAVKFDKLGAQDAVLKVEALRDQKRLMPDTQFLTLLDRVANNESFLHMARDRAAALAEYIRKPK